MAKSVKRIFFQSYNNKWQLSTFQSNHLASLNDLNEWACVGGLFKDLIVQVTDGFFEWHNNTYIDTFGQMQYAGEYEEVLDLKSLLLDILEDMEFEDSYEYETVIGWTNWRCRKFLGWSSLDFGKLLSEIREFDSINNRVTKPTISA
ncbi:hypothetical protein [Paenibacillus elgii]|uniref:hypothetical protein n=1 Tax=Paenibacillus elgii TaxID=189691 RepID=UPI000248D269|nr:hypothetical protein [Paenibacillus elgii]